MTYNWINTITYNISESCNYSQINNIVKQKFDLHIILFMYFVIFTCIAFSIALYTKNDKLEGYCMQFVHVALVMLSIVAMYDIWKFLVP